MTWSSISSHTSQVQALGSDKLYETRDETYIGK